MAGKIKGITVEIGGSTTGLNKALSSVNKEISGTQSELKQVEKLLKFDPTNTELLKQKQDLLKKSVGDTADKLKTLKEAEKQVQQQVKNGEASQEQYRALQREIAKTEQALKSTAKQAAESNSAISKIGDVSKKVSETTKGLSAAAGGLIAGMGASAVKAGIKADDLNTLAKQTGLTTAEIQKFSYASDIVDVSTEDITKSLAKMTKNMGSTSKETQAAWKELGISTKDASGHMRNTTDVFYDTLTALSKVSNETERDQLAMQLFGKSANSLAGIVDDGGASLKQLGQEAENAGLIMSQDALDSANKFNDAIDRLKATGAARFNEIGTTIATKLLPHMDSICNTISKIIEWIANLSPHAWAVIGTITAIIAAISPIAGVISGIATIMGVLSAAKAVNTAATVAETAAQTGLNLAMLPVISIILAVITVIGLLVAAIVLCVKHFDTIKQVAANAWNKILYGANMAWYGIKYGVISVANFVIGCINKMIEGVLRPFNSMIDALNLIPNVNIKHLSWKIDKIKLPEMPKMASGGILKGSAIVGEAGPEVLTNLGGTTQVTPLTGSNGTHALGANLADVMNKMSAIENKLDYIQRNTAADTSISIDKRNFGRLVREV